MLAKTLHCPLHVTQGLERVLHVTILRMLWAKHRVLFGMATLRTETPSRIVMSADVNVSTASRYATLSVQLRLRPLACPRRHERCSRARILLYTRLYRAEAKRRTNTNGQTPEPCVCGGRPDASRHHIARATRTQAPLPATTTTHTHTARDDWSGMECCVAVVRSTFE